MEGKPEPRKVCIKVEKEEKGAKLHFDSLKNTSRNMAPKDEYLIIAT